MYLTNDLVAFFDIAIILILIAGVGFGVMQGFLIQLLNLLSLLVALLAAYLYAPVLAKNILIYNFAAEYIDNTALSDVVNYNLNQFIWFVIIFIIVSILLSFLKIIINRVGKLPVLKHFNRFLGGVFGAIKSILILVFASFLLSTPLFLNGVEFKDKTLLRVLDNITEQGFSIVGSYFDNSELVQELINNPAFVIENRREDVENWLISNGYTDTEAKDILDSFIYE